MRTVAHGAVRSRRAIAQRGGAENGTTATATSNRGVAVAVRTALFRVLGVCAGAQLAIIVTGALAQIGLPPVAAPTPHGAQQVATVVAVRWGMYVVYAILGSGAWAFARPPGIDPYFSAQVRHPIMRTMYTGFAWGMFALAVGSWLECGQGPTTTAVFVMSVAWEFMMLTVVWLGRRFSSNPVQFWQDMRAGRRLREREELDETIEQARRREGGMH